MVIDDGAARGVRAMGEPRRYGAGVPRQERNPDAHEDCIVGGGRGECEARAAGL
jgi:hypothetical protein